MSKKGYPEIYFLFQKSKGKWGQILIGYYSFIFIREMGVTRGNRTCQ